MPEANPKHQGMFPRDRQECVEFDLCQGFHSGYRLPQSAACVNSPSAFFLWLVWGGCQRHKGNIPVVTLPRPLNTMVENLLPVSPILAGQITIRPRDGLAVIAGVSDIAPEPHQNRSGRHAH